MEEADDETILSGTILLGEDFEPFEGYLVLRRGVVEEVGSGKIESDLVGIIAPALVNGHVHLGDSV
ncbi:MAG: amidohydrolase, partial [Methanothrix sp.]